MSAPKNFSTGFNHNIKHRGQVFHVQTEDSGEGIAVVATHLFIGGTIVATRRQSYAELRELPDRKEQVRARMERQHKQMLRDLVNGEFDARLQGVKAYQPGQLAMGGSAGPAQAIRPLAETPLEHAARVTSTGAGKGIQPVPNAIVLDDIVLTDLDIEAVELLDLDILVEEDTAFISPGANGGDDLPWARAAATATLFDDGVVGTDRALVSLPPQPATAPAQRGAPAAPGFADELISERSLDEVILAYLAESDE